MRFENDRRGKGLTPHDWDAAAHGPEVRDVHPVSQETNGVRFRRTDAWVSTPGSEQAAAEGYAPRAVGSVFPVNRSVR